MVQCISWALRGASRLNCRHQPNSSVVCYSSGIDSSVLLLSDALVSPDPFGSPAVHIRHFLTSITQDYVSFSFSASLQVRASLRTGAVLLARGNISFELEGKLLRQKLFGTCWETRTLRLGHQSEDLRESFEIQLLRGSYWAGLSGIPLVGLSGLNQMKLRPFLSVRRPLLRNFVTICRGSWLTDPTNSSTSNLRGYLRSHSSDRNGEASPVPAANLVGLVESFRLALTTIQEGIRGRTGELPVGRAVPTKATVQHSFSFWLKAKSGIGVPAVKLKDMLRRSASFQLGGCQIPTLLVSLDRTLTQTLGTTRK